MLHNGYALVNQLYREEGPSLGTPAIALVLFHPMYLFGGNSEHAFIQ